MIATATINSMGHMTLEKLALMMGAEFKNIDQRFEGVYEEIGRLGRRMEAGFQTMRAEMSDIRSDIFALKEDMKEVKEDIGMMKKDIETMKEDTDVLKKESQIHHAELAGLDGRVVRLEKGVI